MLDPLPFALTCTERALLIIARKQSNSPSWLMVAAELTASAIALYPNGGRTVTPHITEKSLGFI